MHTGDIGEHDEDGFYYVLGRKDNMIISGGENIYSSEVEEALYEHPAIKEVVVFGVPSEEWGQAVMAVLVTLEGVALNKADVSEFLEGTLAGFKHPKRIEVVESLPRTGSGKVARNEVTDRYGA